MGTFALIKPILRIFCPYCNQEVEADVQNIFHRWSFSFIVDVLARCPYCEFPEWVSITPYQENMFKAFFAPKIELGSNDIPPEVLMEQDGRPTLSPDGTS